MERSIPVSGETPQTSPEDTVSRAALSKEVYMMGLYVSASLLWALTAIAEHEEPNSTSPRS